MNLTKTFGAVLLGLGLTATAAAAERVEVRGIQYDVSARWTTDYELFSDQVWWHDRDLAFEFAGVVGDKLGYPNIHDYGSLDPRLNWGPYFAYDGIFPISNTDNVYLAVYYSNHDLFAFDGQSNIVRYGMPINFNAYFYAYATEVSPVPAPAGGLLFLTGLAAVAGRVGCLRKKVAA